jgi:hypothetical protein
VDGEAEETEEGETKLTTTGETRLEGFQRKERRSRRRQPGYVRSLGKS